MLNRSARHLFQENHCLNALTTEVYGLLDLGFEVDHLFAILMEVYQSKKDRIRSLSRRYEDRKEHRIALQAHINQVRSEHGTGIHGITPRTYKAVSGIPRS